MINETVENIVNNFGIWLRILNHDVIADAIGCPVSRVNKYARMEKDELLKKISLEEIVKLEKLVNEKYELEYTDAPNVRVESVIKVID